MPGVPAPPLANPITFPDEVVVLAESIFYYGLDGQPVQVSEGGVSIPAPVVAAAVALGIGHAPDSRQAELITNAMKAGRCRTTVSVAGLIRLLRA